MSRRPWGETRHAEEAVLAVSLPLVALAVVTIRALRNPVSRLSRWVDRNVLPYGVTNR